MVSLSKLMGTKHLTLCTLPRIAGPRQNMHFPQPVPSTSGRSTEVHSHCPPRAEQSKRSAVGKLHARPLQETDTERRLRESQVVDERITVIYNMEDFRREMKEAEGNLVVLEAASNDICQTGFEEEAEIHYKVDQEAALAPCRTIKHVFERTARDSPDVVFLALEIDSEEGQQARNELGIDCIPTVQFWKDNVKLWEHKGIVGMGDDLGEGVLFYGDTAANNVRASDHVHEVTTRGQLDAWLALAQEKELSVLDVSLTSATPCVHIFPAVLALAKNMVGFASFARLMADANQEATDLARELKVVQVPTFIFFRHGKEVGRHVGSTRGDLIGQILQQQNTLGIRPPPVQGKVVARR